jgi:hypothetical protein
LPAATPAAPLPAQVARVGAVACMGVAAAYLATAIAAGLMPAELQGRPEISAHEFWTALARTPGAHLAYHWAWVAAGLCGLAALPAVSLWLGPAHPGAMLWSASAGWLGFAVLARSHLMEAAFDRRIIPVYEQASPAFQEAVHVVAGLALDVPDGVLTHGAIGVWMVTAALLAGRHGLAPRAFAALGLSAGVAQLAGVAGYAIPFRPLLVVSIGAGGILAPLWFFAAALRLRRLAGAAGSSRS